MDVCVFCTTWGGDLSSWESMEVMLGVVRWDGEG